MVDKLTDEHVREIRYVFNLFDAEENDGNLTKSEMVGFLKKLGIGLSDAEVNELFDMFDASGNGTIDYPEFLSLMTKNFEKPADQEDDDQYLKDSFELFDEDEDGLLTKGDLYTVFSRLGVKKITKKEIDIMIDEVAPEANGYIDFEIFKQLVTTYM